MNNPIASAHDWKIGEEIFMVKYHTSSTFGNHGLYNKINHTIPKEIVKLNVLDVKKTKNQINVRLSNRRTIKINVYGEFKYCYSYVNEYYLTRDDAEKFVNDQNNLILKEVDKIKEKLKKQLSECDNFCEKLYKNNE